MVASVFSSLNPHPEISSVQIKTSTDKQCFSLENVLCPVVILHSGGHNLRVGSDFNIMEDQWQKLSLSLILWICTCINQYKSYHWVAWVIGILDYYYVIRISYYLEEGFNPRDVFFFLLLTGDLHLFITKYGLMALETRDCSW